MNRRQVVSALGIAAMVLGVVPLTASPAGAVSAPEVVAEGLDAPYKLTFGPDGALHVAEAGTGGGTCIDEEDPESGETTRLCYGSTGAVTRIEGDVQERVVSGLPSLSTDTESVGPADVAFSPDGLMHVIVGLGGDDEFRTSFGDERLGTILTIDDEGVEDTLVDLVAFEEVSDPDADQPSSEGVDSNPFGLTFDGEDVIAVDAGGNSAVRVAPDGTPTLEFVFEDRMAEAPPFLGLPPGTMIPYQWVPTAVDVDPVAERPFVGNLTGFPFPVGAASVLGYGDAPRSHGGFTNIIDIDFAPDGTLYVLEFADNGLLSEAPAPALIQVRPDGTRKYLVYGDELPVPGGVEVGPDGMVYLSVCTLCGPGEGMVWRIDPSVPSDPATAALCDPTEVPGTDFPDIKASVHREAVECLAAIAAVAGFADGTFGPNLPVTRAQAASLIARGLEAGGVALPEDPPDAFSDDDGSDHEGSIDALAAMGVITGKADGSFGVTDHITRAQFAAMFARAWQAVTGEPLPAGPDAFGDDDDSVHEDDINAVARAGWVLGVGDGQFGPRREATRGQFASLLARMLSSLAEVAEQP